MVPKLFKARWVWIGIAICTLVFLGALWPQGDPAGNVQVALVGFTNQAGRKVALFRGTNDSKRSLTYDIDVKTNFPYAYHAKVLLMVQRGGPIVPGQSFTFMVDAPSETADWEPVFMYRLGWTKREEYRTSIAEFLHKVGIEGLAQGMIPPTAEGSIWMNSSQQREHWFTQLQMWD